MVVGPHESALSVFRRGVGHRWNFVVLYSEQTAPSRCWCLPVLCVGSFLQVHFSWIISMCQGINGALGPLFVGYLPIPAVFVALIRFVRLVFLSRHVGDCETEVSFD